MNEILLIVEIIVTFTLLLVAKKLFGKYGVIGWIGLASIIANIQVMKSVTLFGLSATVGNVLFASNFLATDILSENYGKKDAQRGVYFGLFAIICYLIFSQLMLAYKPNSIDFADASMQTLFGLAPRICIASVSMFFLANLIDVHLFDFLKRKFNDKYLWLRNNVCTIICNCTENFFFFLIAYLGIVDIKELIIMALTCSVIETFIALCDTPFLYLSKKIK